MAYALHTLVDFLDLQQITPRELGLLCCCYSKRCFSNYYFI